MDEVRAKLNQREVARGAARTPLRGGGTVTAAPPQPRKGNDPNTTEELGQRRTRVRIRRAMGQPHRSPVRGTPSGQRQRRHPAAGAARRGRPHVRHPRVPGMTFYEVQAEVDHQPGPRDLPGALQVDHQPLPRLHPRLRLLLRPQHPHLSRPRRRARTSTAKVIVKVNAGELLRRELAAPTLAGRAHRHGHQRGLLPAGRGPLPADAADHRGAARPRQPVLDPHQGHADPARPDLLRQAAEVTTVGLSFSVGFVDETLWRSVEPGTPQPRRRLDAVRRSPTRASRSGC